MGTSINAQSNENSEYVLAVKSISNILHIRMFDFLLRFNIFFKLSMSAIRERRALKILHDFTDKVIMARREELLSQQIASEKQIGQEDDLGRKKKMALLDVLLQSTIDNKPLTNMDIREEVDTFMFEV